jgi:hypothetical protein
MPSFRVTATSRPSAIGIPPPPTIPYPLWFEAGVLWAIGPTTFDSLPIGFVSVKAFGACMRRNLPNAKNLIIGPPPFGCFGGMLVAQWSVTTPSPATYAWVAMEFSYLSLIFGNLQYAAYGPLVNTPVFPASCFQPVTANSPAGPVTIPIMPLVLISANPAAQTVLGGGNLPAYFTCGPWGSN